MSHDSRVNVLIPISTVSLLTGVNAITLRAWLRRYGLISPIKNWVHGFTIAICTTPADDWMPPARQEQSMNWDCYSLHYLPQPG